MATTIRGLVKKELVKRGYPVAVQYRVSSKSRSSKLGNKRTSKDGIELEREYFNTYTDRTKLDMTEDLMVRCNGYITEEEMKEIIEECLKDYNPYKTHVRYFIYK